MSSFCYVHSYQCYCVVKLVRRSWLMITMTKSFSFLRPFFLLLISSKEKKKKGIILCKCDIQSVAHFYILGFSSFRLLFLQIFATVIFKRACRVRLVKFESSESLNRTDACDLMSKLENAFVLISSETTWNKKKWQKLAFVAQQLPVFCKWWKKEKRKNYTQDVVIPSYSKKRNVNYFFSFHLKQ